MFRFLFPFIYKTLYDLVCVIRAGRGGGGGGGWQRGLEPSLHDRPS